MIGSTNSSKTICPDVNVWVALSVTRHVHHPVARAWYNGLARGERLWFCRLTQMGLLRLLNQEAVMGAGAALNQVDAWRTYDRWMSSAAVGFMPEPHGIETPFRQIACGNLPMPRRFADDYLAAFAAAAGLRLATCDRRLSRRAPDSILIT
jgi:toxin-antitoxin system PIN domain toxin